MVLSQLGSGPACSNHSVLHCFLSNSDQLDGSRSGYQRVRAFMALVFLLGHISPFQREKQGWIPLLVGTVCCALSIYSWGAGFVTGFSLLVSFSLFKLIRVFRI